MSSLENELLFSKLKFSVFEYGSDLANKRAKLILEIIKNNGGKIIQLKEGKQN